jgi:TP901 family phage tail tape measure protein
MSDLGAAIFKFIGDRSSLDQTWDSVERDNTSWAERLSSGITGAITTAVTGAVVAATTALTGLAAGGLNAFIGFERGMNEVFTLLPGASQSAMGQMSEDVQQFALEFGALPNDVIPALYESLSSGVAPGNVFDFLATAQKAAIGGVTDTKTTVDGLTSVVNAYGADVLSVERASDIMFTGVAYGKTTFAELAASLYNVIPNAQALGVQFSDVTAAIAAMTAQGVPTAQSTTQIRQLLIELSQAGGDASEVFQRVAGTGFKDFIASGRSLQDALILMEEAANQSGVGINDLFSSVEAGGAALTLTGRGTQSFTDALTQMQNSAGATDAAYAQMDQGLGRTIDRIKASFQVLLTDVGERLAPAFQVFLDWVNGNMPQISSVVLGVFDAIGGAISTLLPYFQSFAAGAQQGFGVFIELASAAAQWGSNIGQQLANGIMAAASAVVSSLSYLGGLITYWLEPHSPPKLLPHLDQWGTDAANVYMAGWGEADFGVFDTISSTIETLLKGLVDSDTLPEDGYIPMLLGSRAAVATALNELRATGSVSEVAFRSVRESAGAAGDQVDSYFRSLVALEQVNRQAAAAQENLNAITKKYDAILSPLEEELAAIEDAQAAVQEKAEEERLLRLINSVGGKDSTREAARLELEALRLRQKIRETKTAQETEEAAAQSQVDAAAEARAALEADLALQEQQIAARQKQNTLIQQQIDLITKAMSAGGGGGGGGGSAMDDAAKKAEAAAKAQRDYNYAVADTDTKLAMLKEDQAKYTQSDAEYWRLQGQISGLEKQRQQELDASAEAQRDYQLSLQDTETRLASLKEEQSQYAVGSEDYNRIQKEIDRVEKDRAKQLEEVEKKNAEATRAERDYQYAVSDTGGKLDILRGELANTTEGSADYWRIKTQVNALEQQQQKELEATSKAMGGATAATGGLSGGVGGLAGGVGDLSGMLGTVAGAAGDVPGPIDAMAQAADGAKQKFVDFKDKQLESMDTLVQSVRENPIGAALRTAISDIQTAIVDLGNVLAPAKDAVMAFVGDVKEGFAEDGIVGAIQAGLDGLGTILGDLIEQGLAAIRDIDWAAFFATWPGGILAALTTIFGGLTLGPLVAPLITGAGPAITGAFTSLSTALAPVGVALGGVIMSTLRLMPGVVANVAVAVDWLAGVFGTLSGWLGRLLAPLGSLFGWIMQLLTPLGSLFGWVSGLLSPLGALLGPLGSLGGALGTLIGPLLGALAPFIAIGGAIALLLNQTPELKATLEAWAAQFGQWVIDAIPLMFGALNDLISQLLTWLGEQLPGVVTTLVGWSSALFQFVLDAIPGLLDGLAQLLGNIFTFIVENGPNLIAQLLAWGASFVGWVIDALPQLGTNLGEFLGKLLGFIVDAIPGVVSNLASLAAKFVDWVLTDVIPNLPGALLNIANGIYNFIAGVITEVGPKITELAGKFYNWITDEVLPVIPTKLGEIWTAIETWISDTATKALEAAKSIGSGIGDGISGAIEDGLSGLRNFVAGIINPIITGINTVIDGLNLVNPMSDIPHIGYMAEGGITSKGLVVMGEEGLERVQGRGIDVLAGPGLYNVPAGLKVTPAAETATGLMNLPRGVTTGGMGGDHYSFQFHITVDARGTNNPAAMEAVAIRAMEKQIAELEARIKTLLLYKRG